MMVNRYPFFKSIFLFLFLVWLAGGDLAAKRISISPLTIQTNNGKQRFSTVFELTNRTKRSQSLAALIVFKNNRVKWWRGVKLPVLDPRSRQKYFLEFNSRLILAMDFDNIYVLIYDKDYQQFIDSSSKHGRIRSDVMFNGDVKLKLAGAAKDNQSKTFVLGEKKRVLKSLKSSKKSNAVIKSRQEVAQIPGQGDVFVQTPVAVADIEEPEFIDEQNGVTINVDHVFAQYFTAEPNPMLTYHSIHTTGEPDFINIAIDKPEQLNIAEQEKIVSVYVDKGQSEKAIVFLSEQLTMAPDKVDTVINLSNVYLTTGDKNSALEVLNASLANISFSKRVAVNRELTERSKEATSQADIKEAEFLARQFGMIGQSFLDEEKYFQALKAFESLQTIDPSYPGLEAKLNLCREKIRETELQKVMASLEKENARSGETVLTDSEPKTEALTSAGEEVAEKRVASRAPPVASNQITKRGVVLESGTPDVDAVIDYYVKSGETDKAEFFLKEQIEAEPHNFKAILRLVQLHQGEGRGEEANDLLLSALASLAEDTRQSVLAELRDQDTAQGELSDAAALARAYEARGTSYLYNNDCDNAHPLFRNLSRLIPGYPGVEQRIAECEDALGRYQELALTERTKAVLTADVITANGQILLTGIPRYSTVYLFKEGELIAQNQTELSQYRSELEPGEYALFIQSYGYEDYRSLITIAAQTLLNENVSLTAIDQPTPDRAGQQSGSAEEQVLSATQLHQYGW